MADALMSIRKVIKDYLEYAVLGDVIMGTVVSTAPVIIKIDNDIELTEEFLILDTPLPPIAKGEAISLQRKFGGQKFYVLPKTFWE